MSRNALVALVIVLVAALGVVAYLWYQDSQSSSLQISVGEEGVSIEAD